MGELLGVICHRQPGTPAGQRRPIGGVQTDKEPPQPQHQADLIHATEPRCSLGLFLVHWEQQCSLWHLAQEPSNHTGASSPSCLPPPLWPHPCAQGTTPLSPGVTSWDPNPGDPIRTVQDFAPQHGDDGLQSCNSSHCALSAPFDGGRGERAVPLVCPTINYYFLANDEP